MDRVVRNLNDLRRAVPDLTQRGIRVQFIKEWLTFYGRRHTDDEFADESDGVVRAIRTRAGEGRYASENGLHRGYFAHIMSESSGKRSCIVRETCTSCEVRETET